MIDLSTLPLFNACLNGLSSLFLLGGRAAIAMNREHLHRRLMSAAFTTSIVFLSSYLYYHLNTEIFTTYQGPAWGRLPYYLMLFTHIVLAVLTAPAIVYLLVLALRKQFLRHKKLATYVWPLWLYVSITGVAIYLVLY